MICIKTVSQSGLERVFSLEGVVQGIYDCPAHHATFGMGTLIHYGPSRILGAVRESGIRKTASAVSGKTNVVDLSDYLRTYQKSKKSPGVEYLSVDIGSDVKFEAMKESLSSHGDAETRKLIEEESKYLRDGWKRYLAGFRDGIHEYEQAICAVFPGVPLTQRQFDGLFSLTYNIGVVGLKSSKGLISAMKRFAAVTSSRISSDKAKHDSASALLDQILRARPTAPALVSGEVEKVSFRLRESGVFNGGLFNRRVSEASMIIGHTYSIKDDEIKIGRRTIKGTTDHHSTASAESQVRTVIQGLNAISRISRGGL